MSVNRSHCRSTHNIPEIGKSRLVGCCHPGCLKLLDMEQKILKNNKMTTAKGKPCNYVACEGQFFTNNAFIEDLLPRAQGHVAPIVLLRDPLTHIVSMWSHCQQHLAGRKGWTSDQYRKMSFAQWVHLHAIGDVSEATTACTYLPTNVQVK